MPVADETFKTSWAEVEETHEDEDTLPPPDEKIHGDTKIVTEYSYEDNKKIKIISHYSIKKHKVNKRIAERKLWQKFGQSANDKPGPNPATTITSEDVYMQFLTSNEDTEGEQDEMKKKLMDTHKGQVKCRLCKEDHWTTQCPYKEKLEPLHSSLMGEKKEEEPAPSAPSAGSVSSAAPSVNKYLPPSKREGASKKGESMSSNRDEQATVRVTNLSENTEESDLQELFHPFGDIIRICLVKDKNTGISKGFAFINFRSKESAARAIETVNGFGYDHLILSVEWARPTNQS